MNTQTNITDDLEYQLILVTSESRNLLVLGLVSGDSLPRVRIPRGVRIARELQKVIRERWNLIAIIIDLPIVKEGTLLCAVAEVLSSTTPPGLLAIRMTEQGIRGLETLPAELVSRWNGNSFSDKRFSRIGWIDQAIAWVETETGKKLCSRGEIKQYNAGGDFTLIRFRMEDSSDVWLKATGHPNEHEFSVTCLLSELAGEYLPKLIATRPEWNAWLMSGDSSQRNEPCTDSFTFLGDAVGSLAALQFKTVGHRSELLDAGAFDQSMAVFQGNSRLLFEFLEEAMQLQKSRKAAPLESGRLWEIRSIFEDTIRRTEDLGLPETIVHGDMNRDNIHSFSGSCQFLDWSEAYVGCPLVTLQHLLLLNRMENPEARIRSEAVLKEKYQKHWTGEGDKTAIRKGFVYMELLAVVSTLYGRGYWLSAPARDDPRRQSYARNLARHMDRAARSPGLIEALGCQSIQASEQVPAVA